MLTVEDLANMYIVVQQFGNFVPVRVSLLDLTHENFQKWVNIRTGSNTPVNQRTWTRGERLDFCNKMLEKGEIDAEPPIQEWIGGSI